MSVNEVRALKGEDVFADVDAEPPVAADAPQAARR